MNSNTLVYVVRFIIKKYFFPHIFLLGLPTPYACAKPCRYNKCSAAAPVIRSLEFLYFGRIRVPFPQPPPPPPIIRKKNIIRGSFIYEIYDPYGPYGKLVQNKWIKLIMSPRDRFSPKKKKIPTYRLLFQQLG